MVFSSIVSQRRMPCSFRRMRRLKRCRILLLAVVHSEGRQKRVDCKRRASTRRQCTHLQSKLRTSFTSTSRFLVNPEGPKESLVCLSSRTQLVLRAKS